MKKAYNSKAKSKSSGNLPQLAAFHIALNEINLSPFNYRYDATDLNEASLAELAASIRTHGVIQPITVRMKAGGAYEIVVGERRFRASLVAERATIPCVVRELTDEQVKEMQLVENLQREDPHPMAEAMGFNELLHLKSKKNSVKEIAVQVGKSESYVYQRLKLNELTEPFRKMYLAGALTSVQAVKLARLDAESQSDFFAHHCTGWEDKGWEIYNFNGKLKCYQLSLRDAPFDIQDAKLDKAAGACTKCPHNTAVTSSLFPEESSDARCTNRPCYDNKSKLFGMLSFAAILHENPGMPIAVEDDEVLAQFFAIDDRLIRGRSVLSGGIDFSDYEKMEEKPRRDDFDWNEEDDENEEEYKEALAEWTTESQRLDGEAEAGNYVKAILISEEGLGTIVYLYNQVEGARPGCPESEPAVEVKAKDYQEAVKNKTLTSGIIEGERARLLNREKRAKEMDEEKLQETFYEALENSAAVREVDTPAGTNDHAALLVLVYEKLGYSGKEKVKRLLFPDGDDDYADDERLIRFFFEAGENQVSLLMRIAMLDDVSAKNPRCLRGKMLRKVVESTPGLNAETLVIAQRQKREEREEKLSEKLSQLKRQAEKLNTKAKDENLAEAPFVPDEIKDGNEAQHPQSIESAA